MGATGLPGRQVTVVIARDGAVVGQAAPFQVSTPWWNDVSEISARHPGLAVLRLLDGRPVGRPTFAGAVRYLAEWLEGTPERDQALLGALEPSDAPLVEDPLRMPWARPGGPGADLSWAASVVEVAGSPRQHRTWNLSAIWEIPTTSGRAWLKCVPRFMGHETAVLDLLREHRVPRVLGADRHRQLLADLPGHDGYDATTKEYRALIDLLVAMQATTVGRDDELLALGVTDRRWAALLEVASDVVARHLPQDPVLRRLLDEAADRTARIDECGLPYVLVHGDAHPGNARIGADAGGGYWFDWGDSRLGHPMLDLAVLDRPGVSDAGDLRAHWMAAWGAACPGSDPTTAWALAEPLAALGDAVVYQGFLDRIESSERPYHLADVPHCLERAARLAAQR